MWDCETGTLTRKRCDIVAVGGVEFSQSRVVRLGAGNKMCRVVMNDH